MTRVALLAEASATTTRTGRTRGTRSTSRCRRTPPVDRDRRRPRARGGDRRAARLSAHRGDDGGRRVAAHGQVPRRRASSPAASSSSPVSSGLGLLRARRLPQRVQQRAGLAGRLDLAGDDAVLHRRRRRRAVRRPASSPAATCASRSSAGRSSAACRWPLLGQVEERWQLYAVYAVFALGFAGAGLIPVTTVVTRWYHVRRSVALSVASTGPVGRRHRAHAARQVADRRPRPGGGDADPRRRVAARHPAVRPVARAARPGGARLAARRRAGASPTSPPLVATGMPFAEAVRTRFFVAHDDRLRRSCSAPRSAASSSSSSSSRTAPTRARRRWPRRARRRCRSSPGSSAAASCPACRSSGSPSAWPPCRRVALVGASRSPTTTAGDLRRDHPVRRDRRQHPDAAAAADRRALRRPRLPAASSAAASSSRMVGTAGGPLLLGWLYDNAGGYGTSYLVAAALLADRMRSCSRRAVPLPCRDP